MAGAGYKTFTAGEVLTASDVNTYLMQQSVQNYGGTAARSSAIPTPSTGMVSYIGDDGNGVSQIQAYNGSAWNNMGGLVLIKTQTIGTGVSSVTVTGAFSSTYDNYKIIVGGGVGGQTNGTLNLTLGSVNTGYYAMLVYASYSSGTVQASGANNGSSFPFAGTQNLYSINANIEINSPYLTEQKLITSAFYDTINAGRTTGICDSLASQTSFTLTANSGTMTGGTIAVYGYRKA